MPVKSIYGKFDLRREGKRKHLKTTELIPCDNHPDRPAVRFESKARTLLSHGGYFTQTRRPRCLCAECYKEGKRHDTLRKGYGCSERS